MPAVPGHVTGAVIDEPPPVDAFYEERQVDHRVQVAARCAEMK
jgi:hypothetical protein